MDGIIEINRKFEGEAIILTAKMLKICCFLGILFNSLCLIIDYLNEYENFQLFLTIRMIEIFFLTVILYVMYKNLAVKKTYLLGIFIFFLVSAGKSLMVYFSIDNKLTYYEGMTLVVLALGLFVPWKTKYTVVTCSLIYLFFLLQNIFFESAWSGKMIFRFNFFLASVISMAILASITSNRIRFKIFKSRYELEESNKKLERNNEELGRMATTDSLTEIYNRRFFYDLAAKEFKKAKRSGGCLSIIMMDIDDFKKVNDGYGHEAGDEALKLLALKLSRNLRSFDIFARFGGEEFIILLPSTGQRDSFLIAERLSTMLACEGVIKRNEADIHVTVSMGVSGINPSDTSIDEIIKRADSAMYSAKNKGKNTVAECILD